ncbi:UDP-glucuronosyltransferase [Thermoflavimicrobium daqui]|uniref:UDP-glucuronosyltransferase n=1 Tax=Thermoflavimicrobium daqui TaxID=2137476 RepID=A0A364K158_9BACL|nr:UDP-glucuronosyltransferase [Thermoflavimicrobium daqui]RAL21416.1 UDP-glucuronosyltransferase [Thermoflavimicrobium daqui]
MFILENLYKEEVRERIPLYKKAFHQSFSVALTGYKLTRDIGPVLDEKQVEQCLCTWAKEKRKRFVALTGFWIPILERYKQRIAPELIEIDLLHLDACDSPSFRVYASHIDDSYQHIWLYRYDQKQMFYEISITKKEPIPFEQREDRFMIHGGGWGIGTYQSKIPELRSEGFKLNITAYYPEDLEDPSERDQFFIMDPSWQPWHRSKQNHHTFPPMRQVGHTRPISPIKCETRYAWFDVIRQCKAIISKLGGATLVDSLAAATPIIFLEPFGDHEQKNADLWEHFGFGISYERWKQSGFSEDLLRSLSANLFKARGSSIDYGGTFYATKNIR